MFISSNKDRKYIFDTKIIENKFAMIKERVIQLIESKGIPKESFYIKIGMTSASFRGKAKETPLNSNAIENILSEIPDVSPEWLLTGKGEMLKNTHPNTHLDTHLEVKNRKRIEEKEESLDKLYLNDSPINAQMSLYKLRTDYFGSERQSIPLYEIDAAAGLAMLFSSQVQQIPIDHIIVPNAPKCDGAVYIRGDSMYPILKSGDIACYKTINDLNNIYYGDMHLLDFDIEGDQHLTVKYVQKSDLGDDYVRLVSHNDHYAPKDIHKSTIRGIALIKLSIRYNSLA